MEQIARAAAFNNFSWKGHWCARLYDSSPFAFRVIDCNYIVTDINQSFIALLSEITGKPLAKEDILGKHCYELIGKAFPCQNCLLVESIKSNKSSMRKETFPTLHGRTFEIHTQPIMQSSETGHGVLELLVEVTAQQSFEELVNLLSDAVYIVDIATRKILAANHAACKVLGYDIHQLLNLRLEDIDPNYNETEFQQFLNAMLTGERNNVLIESSNKDALGTVFPVEVHISIIHFCGKRALIGVNRDIRERKRAEKMAREADEQLTRLDRLNLLGEMAASISHEIRNPLTTVRGFLQMLKSKNEFVESRYAEYFDTMIEEIDRANAIISEFLSLAKNKSISLEPHNLNVIISRIFPLIQADAVREEKSITLELGEIPYVLLDENQIRQCILNLVRNGLEATKNAGVVSIKTYMDNDNVVLEVKDNGGGIPQDILEKLGTPFITTKDKGTGLGIPICYRIVERHKAKIQIDTNSSGTAILITFNK